MITVEHDGGGNDLDCEDCSLCFTPTHYWFREKDVPVCRSCAHTAVPEQVPSKAKWLNSTRPAGAPRLPPGWLCEVVSAATAPPPKKKTRSSVASRKADALARSQAQAQPLTGAP